MTHTNSPIPLALGGEIDDQSVAHLVDRCIAWQDGEPLEPACRHLLKIAAAPLLAELIQYRRLAQTGQMGAPSAPGAISDKVLTYFIDRCIGWQNGKRLDQAGRQLLKIATAPLLAELLQCRALGRTLQIPSAA